MCCQMTAEQNIEYQIPVTQIMSLSMWVRCAIKKGTASGIAHY